MPDSWLVPQLEPWITGQEAALVAQCLGDNWITEGPKAAAFMEALQELLEFPYGVFAPNGTLGLYLGMLALGLEPGSEILIPNITFYASASAAVLAGLKPVFCDVCTGTYQIDVSDARRRITDQTVAIMPVHLFGGACDMGGVMDLAQECGLWVIEDACQAVGVLYGGKQCGTFGDIGVFSFFADKTITTGEGGLVVCANPDLYRSLRHMRNQGRESRGSFWHEWMGWNFRITDLQAAVGLGQMSRIREIMGRKWARLQWYQERLQGVPEVRFLEWEPDTSRVVPFRAVIFAENVQGLIAHLVYKRIQPRGFFQPMHRQPQFASGYDPEDFPIARQGADTGLCLPVFPTLEESQIDYVCRTIQEFYGR